MWDEKFKKDAVSLYDTFFNNGEHEIGYINKPGKPSLIEAEYTIVQKEFVIPETFMGTMKLISELKKYDYVVIHSYRLGIWATTFFLLNSRLRKKLVWIAWGFDLYTKRPEVGGLKAWVNYVVSQAIKQRVGHFVGIFPPDCEYYKKRFPKSKANVYWAPYCGNKVPEEFQHYSSECRLEKTRRDNDAVYIQIGHYALDRLNHIDVLQKLEKWKNENIMLFIPLSYGNDEYANKVQAYAENMFPGKTLILRNMMPRDAYFALTERVDIGIFDTTRQCGLANITRMAFRNVKLYMAEDSVMYNYFSSVGVPVQSCELLDQQHFSDFATPEKPKSEEKFTEFIKYLSEIEGSVCLWKNIYDTLRGNLNDV